MRAFPSFFLLLQLIVTPLLLSSHEASAAIEAATRPACSPQIWGTNQYICRSKITKPDATVAKTFGERAEYKFGSQMTLLQALTYAGGGEIELLSNILVEVVAALLNAEMYGQEFGLTPEEAISALVSATEVPPDIGKVILEKLKNANSGICSLEPCI